MRTAPSGTGEPLGTRPGACACLAAPPRTTRRGPGKLAWRRSLVGREFFPVAMDGQRERLEGLSRRQPAAVGQRGEPARRGSRRDSSVSRVPAGPLRISLPGVPQNCLSGQRPPPLSQTSPPPPGGRGPRTSPYALVSLRFPSPFKSRSMVIKEGGAAARSSPAGAEGDADPTEGAGCGPPVTSAPGLTPSPRHRGGQAGEGRPGHGHRLRSTCPAKPLYREDEKATFVSGSSSSTFPASHCPSPALLPP